MEKKNHFDYAVETAIEAFWNDVASSYPEVKTGDVSPEAVASFEQFAHLLLNQWLHNNVAEKDHTRDEQCQRYVNDGCCPVCNVGHGNGCRECQGTGYHKPGCSLSDAEGNQQLDVIPDEPDYANYAEEDWRQDWLYDVRNDHTTLGFEEWKADQIAQRAFERDQALREQAKAEHGQFDNEITVFDHASGLFVHPGNSLNDEPFVFQTTEEAEAAREAVLKANNNAQADKIILLYTRRQAQSERTKAFTFTIHVTGYGKNAQEAWRDYLENLDLRDLPSDPDDSPMTYTVSEIE